MQSESSNKGIFHVGILVKDVDEAAKKFEKIMGIGPFQILDPAYREMTVRGHEGKFKMRIAFAKAGSVQVELIQPLSGETIYDECIRRKEYGLHHLAIRSDNMDQTIEDMERKGFQVIQSGSRPGVRWAYFDTDREMDVIFEFIERKESLP